MRSTAEHLGPGIRGSSEDAYLLSCALARDGENMKMANLQNKAQAMNFLVIAVELLKPSSNRVRSFYNQVQILRFSGLKRSELRYYLTVFLVSFPENL